MREPVFRGRYLIEAGLRCVTGLRIGGTQEGFEIGGLDNPVVKDPLTDLPYIPGSSLKGKMRSLLEWAEGKVKFEEKDGKPSGKPHSCGRWECDICTVFGTAAAELKEAGHDAGPTRLIVRDAFPTEETKKRWENFLGPGVFTEIKSENCIDRLTSEADPRAMERVPAGSEFRVNMVLDCYSEDGAGRLKAVFEAMALLEDSALGGCGSRGSGQVEFKDIRVTFRGCGFYRGDKTEERAIDMKGASTPLEVLRLFDEIFETEKDGK